MNRYSVIMIMVLVRQYQG